VQEKSVSLRGKSGATTSLRDAAVAPTEHHAFSVYRWFERNSVTTIRTLPKWLIVARALTAAAAVSALAACSSPPQAAVNAARTALDAAARDPDVVTYAPDELRNAQDKLNALEAELARQSGRSALTRNYDASAALAQEASTLAGAAAQAAEAGKKQVASDAAELVDQVTSDIPTFESRVWAAKRVPRIKLELIAPLSLVPDEARAAVDEARKDIASGSFASAKARLMAARDELSSSEETITEQVRIARGR